MTFSMGFPSNFNLVTSPTFNPWLSISNLISSTSIPACTLLATILQILHFLWTGPLLLARVLPHTTFARSACQVLWPLFWPLFGVGLLLGGKYCACWLQFGHISGLHPAFFSTLRGFLEYGHAFLAVLQLLYHPAGRGTGFGLVIGTKCSMGFWVRIVDGTAWCMGDCMLWSMRLWLALSWTFYILVALGGGNVLP